MYWILYGNIVDFSFIVSLYVSDLHNVTIVRVPRGRMGQSTHGATCHRASICLNPIKNLQIQNPRLQYKIYKISCGF